MTHNEQDVERVATALQYRDDLSPNASYEDLARAALDALAEGDASRGLPSREQIARMVQDASCRMETEHADWESGTKGFTWCDVHNSDAQSVDPKDYGEVCPKALETADTILALMPAAPVDRREVVGEWTHDHSGEALCPAGCGTAPVRTVTSVEAERYVVINGWLVENVGHHTCGAGDGMYGHEPGCGQEPIAKVEDLLTPATEREVVTVEQELAEWADYFDHYDSHVGRIPLDGARVARLMRGPKPFGVAAGINVQAGGE